MGSNTSAPEVAQGADGNLFLTGGNQRVLDYVSGERKILPDAKRIFRENILMRQRLCTEAGAGFCHLICPDKHAVLSGSFPHPIKVRVGQEFEAYARGSVQYPVDELRALSDNSGYMRTDTHWNCAGMIEIVRQTLLGLKLGSNDLTEMLPIINGLKSVEDGFSGDLGSTLMPKAFESRTRLKTPDHVHLFLNNVVGNNGAIYIAINKTAPHKRLLVFGDSFIISCLDLLSLFFSEIIMVRTAFFHPEMLPMFQPEHVLTASVERYLPHTPTDAEAPVAIIMAALLKKELKPDERFHEVLNALLRQGKPLHKRLLASIS